MKRVKQMQKLKKIISNYMKVISLIIVVFIIIIVTVFNVINAKRLANEKAYEMFSRIENVLDGNKKDLKDVQQEYRDTCLNNARSIAYIIQYHPSVLDSVEEQKKIASFIEVDEIHIFDKTGTIINGTHPEYYHLTFDSGEQIAFFKPLLQNKNLELCQDVTPNTAENKLMQYSALWSENKKFIVQVGMEPINVMKATEKNELSYIFSLLRINAGASFYAIDKDSHKIVGATSTKYIGKDVKKLGMNLHDIKTKGQGFHAVIDGIKSYCVFTEIDNNYVCRVISDKELYQRIPENIMTLAVCLLIISIILVKSVTWYMNKYVVTGIYDINENLREISKGNLNVNIHVDNSVEFLELSQHINDMKDSILSNTKKMSYVLSKTNMSMGIYEYNPHMKKVFTSDSLASIFSLDSQQLESITSNQIYFKKFIDNLRIHKVNDEKNIYEINNHKYIKIEEIEENHDVFGVVIDMSQEIIKRRKIEVERDFDKLTNIYNRRGFENQLQKILEEKDIGYCALIIIDADDLKLINDQFGHEKGDLYLTQIAEMLSSFPSIKHIVGRMGGDEFVLFLHHYQSEKELLDMIKDLEYIQNHSFAVLDEQLSVPLLFSFGYCFYDKTIPYQDQLKIADDKMYKNKHQRKSMER